MTKQNDSGEERSFFTNEKFVQTTSAADGCTSRSNRKHDPPRFSPDSAITLKQSSPVPCRAVHEAREVPQEVREAPEVGAQIPLGSGQILQVGRGEPLGMDGHHCAWD